MLLALLVSLFVILMSRETFHKANRFLLLFIVLLSLVLPLTNVGYDTPFSSLFLKVEDAFTAKEYTVAVQNELLRPEQETLPVMSEASLPVVEFGELYAETTDLPSAVIEEMPVAEPAAKFLVVREEIPLWACAIAICYIAGIAVLLLRQAIVYFQVICIIIKGRRTDSGIYGVPALNLRIHKGKDKPFSWFSWIVVSEEDLRDGALEILVHERAHIAAGHSWDILLADIVTIMQWFNPLAWIMKNSLKDIHEYEADEAVIESGVNAKQYQLLIIKKAVGARLYSIANSFNHSLTKKRITMMCKEKSKKWRCAKALYIVPVAAIAALAFSTVEASNTLNSKGNEFVTNSEKENVENYIGNESCTATAPVTLLKDTVTGEDKRVFMVCEKAPEFPGGTEAMMRFLSANIKYPADAVATGASGNVYVKFVVEADGSVSNIELMRSSGTASLDAEAMRVVGAMPKWNPGMQGGEPVNVSFVVPVAFRAETTGESAPEPQVISLDSGAVHIQSTANALIVVNGIIYEGEMDSLDVNDIESITVVKCEKLTGDFLERCRLLGKDGAIFISTKRKVAAVIQQPVSNNDEAVYQVVEVQPQFPGGESALYRFLSNNIKYPEPARSAGIQGKIFVQFMVATDGSITNTSIVHGDYSSNTINYSQKEGLINEYELSVENFRNLLAQAESQYDRLAEEGTSEAVLARRQEEIANLRVALAAAEENLRLAGAVLSEVNVMGYGSNGNEMSEEDARRKEDAGILALNEEALRVINAMPKWQPGTQGGRKVNVQLTLPVTFRLQ